jgi:hypothetical protein
MVCHYGVSESLIGHTQLDSLGGVINPSQEPLPEHTRYSIDTNIKTFIFPARFELTISENEWLQTHALDPLGNWDRLHIDYTVETESLNKLEQLPVV